MKIDYEDTFKLLSELEECTRAFKDIVISAAEQKGEYEKLLAEEKVILAFSFESMEGKSITEKDKVCRTNVEYRKHLDILAEKRNKYFISFAKVEALKHRMEYLKTRISLTQTIIKIQ